MSGTRAACPLVARSTTSRRWVRGLLASSCVAASLVVGQFWSEAFSFGGSAAPSDLVVSRPAFGLSAGGTQLRDVSPVALHGTGPNMKYTLQLPTKKGMRRQLLKRMPASNLDTEEMMKRIVTVLIRNVDETYRNAPMKTLELMKEIGLRGWQIKEKCHINRALYLLYGQKIINKLKQNPIRWELHERYKGYGLPPISRNKRAPWRLSWILKFQRVSEPKHGPSHGRQTPEDIEELKEYFMSEHGKLPLWMIPPPERVAEPSKRPAATSGPQQ